MAASPVLILGVPRQMVFKYVAPAATHGPRQPYVLTPQMRKYSQRKGGGLYNRERERERGVNINSDNDKMIKSRQKIVIQFTYPQMVLN